MKMELQLLRTRHPPYIFLQQLVGLLNSEKFDVSLEEIQNRIDKLPDKDRLFLAVEGEYLYGYAHLRIAHDLVDTETAVVVSVIVREDRRREGIGSPTYSSSRDLGETIGQIAPSPANGCRTNGRARILRRLRI